MASVVFTSAGHTARDRADLGSWTGSTSCRQSLRGDPQFAHPPYHLESRSFVHADTDHFTVRIDTPERREDAGAVRPPGCNPPRARPRRPSEKEGAEASEPPRGRGAGRTQQPTRLGRPPSHKGPGTASFHLSPSPRLRPCVTWQGSKGTGDHPEKKSSQQLRRLCPGDVRASGGSVLLVPVITLSTGDLEECVRGVRETVELRMSSSSSAAAEGPRVVCYYKDPWLE